MGIEIRNNYIYTLQFADDQVVILNGRNDMEYMMRKLIDEYKNWGLTVNLKKKKLLMYRRSGASSNLDFEDLEEVEKCKNINI